jgi:co-chaperonin GroES (HSP10)
VKGAQVKERSFDKIIIPDRATEKPMEGEVTAMGK